MAQAAEQETMDAAQVGRAYFEAHGRRDLDTVAALWEPGGIGRVVGLADLVAPHGIREFFGEIHAAIPDFTLRILDVVAQDERCAVRWEATGTFAGPGRFQGLEPTGARVVMEGCDVLVVRDGRIQHLDAYIDGADLARQLGAMPPQDSPAEQRMTRLVNLRTRAQRAWCAVPEEVADGVWAVRGGLPMRGFNTYFVRDGDGVALYDTGIRAMAGGLAAAGASLGGITRIVLGHSHLDHRGSAPALRGIPVLCHPAEREDAEGDGGLHYTDISALPVPARWVYAAMFPTWDGGPVRIDGTLEEGDEVAGFEVVHLPGHAPGLIGLWRASNRVAIVGDCFYMYDPPRLRPSRVPIVPPGPFSQDVPTARESMRKLAALDPAVACPGHGEPLRGDVRAALERAAAT
jgi:glyoxylase-like metal-dependent hydrolase (beta-lactamase superfamily II)/predicted ester cyclase